MDKSNGKDAGIALAVSIVLYRPEPSLISATLRTLVDALREAKDFPLARAEVILTDHSPSAQPDARLSQWRNDFVAPLSLHYDHVGGNPGFGAGHNRAFSQCQEWADVFLVANPDIEFEPDSVVAGLRFLAAHPEIGLLAPALVETDGSLRPACFRSPDLLTLFARLLGGSWAARRSYNYECRDWDPGQPVFVPPLMSGCCLLFRADVFDRLGGFDPNYFLYFEDFDLTRRAARLGVSAYCPTMRVKHAGGGAGRKGFVHAIHFLRSALRFFSTHGWRGR